MGTGWTGPGESKGGGGSSGIREGREISGKRGVRVSGNKDMDKQSIN